MWANTACLTGKRDTGKLPDLSYSTRSTKHGPAAGNKIQTNPEISSNSKPALSALAHNPGKKIA